MTANLVAAAASVAGLIISFYFLGIYRGLIKGNQRLVPKRVCTKDSCVSVLETPFARVFRVPNFYVGIGYYGMMSIASLMSPSYSVMAVLAVLSWLAVLFSIYLAWALLVRLKTVCVLCFVSHVLNVVIAVAATIPLMQ